IFLLIWCHLTHFSETNARIFQKSLRPINRMIRLTEEIAMTRNTPLERFKAEVAEPDLIGRLRAGIIGEGAPVPGPQGTHPLVYADYVASGRALRQVEDFVMTEVLPYYANSHTEASFCGGAMTALRRAARAEIARIVGADADHAVIFTGSGATSGLNRLVHL